MTRRRNDEVEDTTGVFKRLLDESENISRIANRRLRGAVSPEKFRIIVATRDLERAENLRDLLIEKEVSRSVALASTAAAMVEAVRDRADRAPEHLLVVVEPELADVARELGCRVVVLNGHDEETCEQIGRET